MFATLIGPYPPIEGPADAALPATISDQLEAGLGMLTDGRLHAVRSPRGSADAVEAWRAADAVGHRLAREAGVDPPLVKACLVGPWTVANGDVAAASEAAELVRHAAKHLFGAGAPVVQVTEPGLGGVGVDDADAHRDVAHILASVTDRLEGHLSLALAGGGATRIPVTHLLGAGFASYLVDVIVSPDDWRLAARIPAAAGLIACVADARTTAPDTEAVVIWGARYAASLRGRGPERVGIAMSAGLEQLPREVAQARLAALAEAARKADLPGDELATVIDPRAVDARSAALGRYEPGRSSRRPGG